VPIIQSGRFLGVVGIDVLPKRIDNPPEDSASAVLSNREVEVLRWVAAGKTNAEIAVILGISPHTVKHHVARVIAKLGVENRRAAMRAWLNGEFSHE
jgi:DNA-binding CsgD family transcriptional regulator